MKRFLLISTYLILLVFTTLCVGWFSNDFYNEYNNQRKLNGFYMANANRTIVEEYQNINDKYGDWVCINVLDMDYPKAYDTCVHECSHKAYSEIFAEECEKDFNKCRGLIDG